VAAQHLDQGTLQELKVIMGGDFNKLLKTFASDSASRVAAIRQAAAATDSDALRRAAHSFKGSSGNMGALRLAELCRQIEELARDGAAARCPPLVDKLVEEYAYVQAELDALR
jgi:HPt (histidine-containing phosphotransfer) domain-containing protein